MFYPRTTTEVIAASVCGTKLMTPAALTVSAALPVVAAVGGVVAVVGGAVMAVQAMERAREERDIRQRIHKISDTGGYNAYLLELLGED